MSVWNDFDPALSHAFLSYAHKDNEYLNGGITWLRSTVESAVGTLTARPFQIFQDVDHIGLGQTWSKKLDQALGAAQFFLPVLTPRFFASPFCRHEAEAFLAYEAKMNRDDLIFPIYLIEADVLENPELRAGDALAAKFWERQIDDWRDLKFALDGAGPRLRVEKLAAALVEAAKRPETAKAQHAGATSTWRRAARRHQRSTLVHAVQAGKGRKEIIVPCGPAELLTRNAAAEPNFGADDEKDEENPGTRSRAFEPGAGEGLPHERELDELRRENERLKKRIEPANSKIQHQRDRTKAPGRRWAPWIGVGLFIGTAVAVVLSVAGGLIQFGKSDVREQTRPSSGKIEDVWLPEESAEPETLAGQQRARHEQEPPTEATALDAAQQWQGVDTASDAPGEALQEDAPLDVSKVTFRDCEQCPEMMIVSPGTFSMGSPKSERGRDQSEGPQHQVTIDHAFAIGVHEVTRAQFGVFVDETEHVANGCSIWDGETWIEDENRDWRDPGFVQTGSDPVVCVSWDDAKAYIAWLSQKTGRTYRLPSEAEWEYAARAGSRTPYVWGDDLGSACDHANGNDEASRKIGGLPYATLPCNDGHAWTAPVGSYGANHFGLHDMAGNVWEWVEDSWHPSYEGAPGDGRAWLDGDQAARVLRGGSWSYNPQNLRSATRRTAPRENRNAGDGFRVVSDALNR